MRLKLILTGVFVALMLLVGVQRIQVQGLKSERIRLTQNQTKLMSEADSYVVRDSLNVKSTLALNLKLKELKKFMYDDLELIGDLQLDVKRLESVSNTSTKTVYEIVTQTVYIKGDSTHSDSLVYVDYKTDWFELEATLDPEGLFEAEVVSFDSLTYVEHVVPKKFLFFKWGIKERRQELVSKNPNTEILNIEFITVTK